MPPPSDPSAPPSVPPHPPSGDARDVTGRQVGRYLIHDEIAAGGMARVFLGRLVGPIRFTRTVAIKCLFPAYARDPEFVAMLMDEAHLASRVRHPNVVATLDVVSEHGELFLVMEYVHGDSLARLLREARALGERVPVAVAVGIVTGLLLGLHAAHEARGEDGEPLGIVHRDVSPQNVLVGLDGVSRVLDFGIAKAASRVQHTADGQVKGKLRYMAPEQLRSQPVDRRTDVFAASAVLWEMLTGRRLFDGPDAGSIVTKILMGDIQRPGAIVTGVPPELDAAVMRGLARSADGRFATAREMAVALEHAVTPATARQTGEWVERVGGEQLQRRSVQLHALERGPAAASGAARRAEEPTAPISIGPPSSGAAVGLPPHKTSGIGEDTDVSASRTAPAVDLGTAGAAPAAPRPARKGRGRLVAAGLLLIGAAGAVAIVLAGGLDRADAPPTEASVAPAAEPSVTSEAAPATTADEPLVASAQPSSSTPPSSAPAPAPRRRVGCDPPYTIENGIKRFKKQCL